MPTSLYFLTKKRNKLKISNMITYVIVQFLLLYLVRAHKANIKELGAIPNIFTFEVAQKNSGAILAAFNFVNSSVDNSDKIVYVPNETYYVLATNVSNMDNISFFIDGTIIALDDIQRWPLNENNKRKHIFDFHNMNNFKVYGNGTLDGNGYNWWWAAILSFTEKTIDDRPHLINIEESRNFELYGLKLINSPRYHISLDDLVDVHLHHFTIRVDVVKQMELLDKWSLPTYPLNTDGIDPSAVNVSIHDFKITNFDDAIAVKPCNINNKYCKCSSNMIIKNGYVKNSVGLAIGSVSPSDNVNCINNITFQNIMLKHPLKAIYVKTNRGSHGSGTISNIKYENITVHTPTWWGIYVGPQQQKQPDGSGEGCMLYPLGPECPTEPRITISNITLKDIRVNNDLNYYSGLVRCNETNPCENIIFDNVKVTRVYNNKGYICENANVTSIKSDPILLCS